MKTEEIDLRAVQLSLLDKKNLIGFNINRLRVLGGLTQQDLAFYCQMERARISEIENSRSIPKICTLIRIAHYFEIDVCDLMK